MKKTEFKKFILMYFLMLLFAAGLIYGYVNHLSVVEGDIYPVKTNPVKLIYGWMWLTGLFCLIEHGKEKASAFLLHFFFTLQMIPITVIYALKDENTVFYTAICISVLICEIIVRFLPVRVKESEHVLSYNKMIIAVFIGLLALFMIQTYRNNGLPTLTALNIYDVYELRRSGLYQIGKYGGYIQAALIKVIIPILLLIALNGRHYIGVVIVFSMEFLIYLYAGQKSFLFIGILVLGVVWWLSQEKLADTFWYLFYGGLSGICFFIHFDIILAIFRLIIRRIFLMSANNKFFYYDFFSTHPKEGIAGIFPRWLIPIESNYGHGYPNGYTFQIANIYYGKPEMNCNTGFIGEGFLRFGLIGILIEFLLLALLLRLVDRFQKKTSYIFAVGAAISFVFDLNDGHLISPLLFGYLTVWIIFILTYRNQTTRKTPEKKQLSSKRKIIKQSSIKKGDSQHAESP